jgi:ATP10 protein
MPSKITSLAVIAMLYSAFVFAQTDTKIPTTDRSALVNTIFPIVNAKTLLGNSIVFPAIAKNKICIVCVAFNDDGRPKSDTWLKEIPAKYTDSSIVFYELPMIKNAPKLFRGAIEKGMRKGTDVKLHNNVANYYGIIAEYKKTLQMDDENSCYTFLLDKNGMIQYSIEGKATQENLKELDDKIKTLTK